MPANIHNPTTDTLATVQLHSWPAAKNMQQATNVIILTVYLPAEAIASRR